MKASQSNKCKFRLDVDELNYQYSCHHSAENNSEYCYYHKIENGKDLRAEDLSKETLVGAYFVEAHLEGSDFRNADLRYARLEGAHLEGSLLEGAKLKGVALRGAHLWGAKFKAIDLLDVDLEGCNLDYVGINDENMTMDELDEIRMRSTKNLETCYKMEKFYRSLKNYFVREGLYEKSGGYFIQEWRVRGQINKLKKKYHLWVINQFIDHFSRYGESPLRVFIWSVILVLIFGLLYWCLSAIMDTSHPTKSVSLLESLHFSIVTFTTLGYGDYYPKQSFQLIADLEAFLGMFIMAFFVVTVSRKIMR